MKHHDHKQPGEEEIYLAYHSISVFIIKGSQDKGNEGGRACLAYAYKSQKEARTGIQTGQKPGGRSWCRGHGTVLFTGLLIVAWPTCFLIEPRMANPIGLGPPTSVTRKMFYRFVCSPLLRMHFLNWDFLFSNNSRLYQVDIKLTSTSYYFNFPC